MYVSIKNLKQGIQQIIEVESLYKTQLIAFEKIYYEYYPIDEDGKDKQILKKVLDDLNEEYQNIKQLKKVLTEIVQTYELTEKNIVDELLVKNQVFIKKLDIGDIKNILTDFNIKLL